MSLLAIDTETSGLWKEGLALTDQSQPALVQLGAQLFNRRRALVGRLKVLIRPDGWSMEPEAEKVHGISERDCNLYGVRLDSALLMLADLCENATRIIAHNMHGFDRKVISAAIHRAGGTGAWWSRKAGALYCTMEASMPVCQLPGEFGWKLPKLEEACAIITPAREFHVKHDAEADIEAMVGVYWTLVDRGVIKEVDPWARP